MMEAAFVASSRPRVLDDLLIRLRADFDIQVAPSLLEEVARHTEQLATQGQWVDVVEVFKQLMERELAVGSADIRRQFGIQIRRLSQAGILRGLAEQLPKHRELRDAIHAIFHRVGDAAADVLVDLLTAAEQTAERRAYRDAIVQLPASAQPLMHMLKDHRWFVVRNAAELLGEMQVADADAMLVDTLTHSDSRVRRAATLSLIRLVTPRAVHTIVRALKDTEASVRLKAALGLARVTNARAVPALLTALDTEEDAQVQHAIMSALAKHPANEAIARLTKEARPGSVLKRRPMSRRLAAIQALGDAGTHEARTVLRSYVHDKERDVRDLAARLLAEPAASV